VWHPLSTRPRMSPGSPGSYPFILLNLLSMMAATRRRSLRSQNR
jgi:hypothetical protein